MEHTKDIIVFVNAIRPATFAALDAFAKQTGRLFEPIILVDKNIKASIFERNGQYTLPKPVKVLTADFTSPASIRNALRPYRNRIFAVTTQYENCIAELQKLISYFPYLPMPTEKSLEWSTEKKIMRALLEAYDPSLVPGYIEVHDSSETTLQYIESKLQYPVVVKPSGLEGSLLVSMAQNREDLQNMLEHIFAEIQTGYDTWIKRQKPAVLVEEFMEGEMYSVDTYVAQDGTCRHAPPVRVLTGRNVGFDDFFGYMRLVPSGLNDVEIKKAHSTAQKACRALGLRAVTGHVELMKTANGWKVIELGPRIGGYRHDIYMLGYDLNHIMNDIRNRAGEEPEIPTSAQKHAAVFNIYARQEGLLESFSGVETVEALQSFVSIRQVVHIGDELKFAKNNGDPVFEVILSNVNEAQFHEDVRTMEAALVIDVKRPSHALQIA